jgi:hypothetical protein
VRRLRGHLVCRQPSPAELQQRTPIVVTARDQQILAAIYQQGFLTTDLVELAFFGPPRAPHRPSTRSYERLRQLWLWQYTERIELPVARIAGGRRPFLYALGQRGVPLVAAYSGDGAQAVQRRRLDRLNALFIDHDLEAAALWANVQALTRPYCIRRFAWTPERELRARRVRVRDPQTRRWLPFLPDAYFEIEYLDGAVQCCLVEIDMGTQALRYVRRKLRAFELALAQGLFARHWHRPEFEVLILTPSLARLEHVWEAARQEVAEERWPWYALTTFAGLDPAAFGGEIWRTLEDERVGLLYAQALPSEPSPGGQAAGAVSHSATRSPVPGGRGGPAR